MPFTQSYEQINDIDLHLMRYSDFDPTSYEDQLTEDEKERLLTFNSLKRRREFTATRVLRHTIFGYSHIHYTPVGSPYLPGEGFISISHAKDIVGIALHKKAAIALDLERVTSKAKHLHEKFLNHNELNFLDCTSELEMTKAWSAKEVLYKLSGLRGLDFKKQLLLFPNQEGYHGEICSDSGVQRVELLSRVEGDLVITLNRVK